MDCEWAGPHREPMFLRCVFTYYGPAVTHNQLHLWRNLAPISALPPYDVAGKIVALASMISPYPTTFLTVRQNPTSRLSSGRGGRSRRGSGGSSGGSSGINLGIPVPGRPVTHRGRNGQAAFRDATFPVAAIQLHNFHIFNSKPNESYTIFHFQICRDGFAFVVRAGDSNLAYPLLCHQLESGQSRSRL